MISMDKVKKVVWKLNSKISSTHGGIPASLVKQTIEVHLKYLTNTISHSLKESNFLQSESNLKLCQYIKNLTLYRRKIID